MSSYTSLPDVDSDGESIPRLMEERYNRRFGLWGILSLSAILGILGVLVLVSNFTESFNVAYGTSQNGMSDCKTPDVEGTKGDIRLQIIIPSYTPHFPFLRDMLHSMACLITDIETIDIAIILSSSDEVIAFQTFLDDPNGPQNCLQNFLNYNTTRATHLRFPPKLTVHNFYNILPPSVQNLTSPIDTGNLVKNYGKYKYQSMKKLAAAAFFDYDYAILLDSEGFVVRPVEFKEMVRQWSLNPVIWHELAVPGSPRRSDWVAAINAASAHTLGRTMEDFGTSVSYWDTFTWILEKEVVTDMVNSPSRLEPGVDFWTRLLNAPNDIFEICVYQIHIAGRKQEQSSTKSSVYTKYRVLDLENALIDFGLGPAYSHIPKDLDVIAQRFMYMALAEEQQDLLVAFIKEYKYFFMYFNPEYMEMIPRDTLESFLRKAPIAMTVSDANDLGQDIVPNSQAKEEWKMTYV